jgi:hypothetical protein
MWTELASGERSANGDGDRSPARQAGRIPEAPCQSLAGDEYLLFGCWELTGSDYAADMKLVDGLAISKEWLALTNPVLGKATERQTR